MRRAPSVLGVRLGDKVAEVVSRLGACVPQELPGGGVEGACLYPKLGVEFGLQAGKVERIVLHSAGSSSVLIPQGINAGAAFQRFTGSVLGLSLGMSAADAQGRLGEPAARLRPLNGATSAEPRAAIWEYPERSVALELQPSGGALKLQRLHIPLAPARLMAGDEPPVLRSPPQQKPPGPPHP